VSAPAHVGTWSGQDVSIAEIEDELVALRREMEEGGDLLTRVMTHVAWVPVPWYEAARETLAGMAERHPSRTILLVPEPDADRDAIDADLALECFAYPGLERHVCAEVIELRLCGTRARAPASVVLPLLVADLPAFLRWRGLPPFGTRELDQLLGVVDRLIVDSTEWPDLPAPYRQLRDLFNRVAASDIAWARTERWRRQLASLWPEIANVRHIGVTGTAAQACLLAGWLRSRLGRDHIAVDHQPAERLTSVEIDGRPTPFPPGDPPAPSDVLSDELERYSRDPVYEAAVAAAAVGTSVRT
jgi:hypothetical protein